MYPRGPDNENGGEQTDDMRQQNNSLIEKLVAAFQCPKDFICYRSGFEMLCKAEDIGLRTYLKCIDIEAQTCVFSSASGDSYLCKCPLRIYLAKEINR